MGTFLLNHVASGGSIPGSHQLQERYLLEVYTEEQCRLKGHLHGQKVCVAFDEMPDAEGRCAPNILIAPIKKNEDGNIVSFLADTVFLQNCDHSTMSQAVIKVLQDYEIVSDDVIAFDTDNAAYMIKACNMF